MDVERDRGDGEQRVALVHAWSRGHRLQEVDDGADLDLHALGLAGRAGGVDHVGQVDGTRHAGQRGLAQRAQARRFAFEAQQGRPDRRQPAEPARLRQHDARAAVAYHVRDAVGRIGRIDRHVGAACLQDRQQADEHRAAAIDADRDAIVRRHALLAQEAGQLVGACIELRVTQRGIVEDRCRRIGTPPRLRLEKRLEPVEDRVRDRGTVPRLDRLDVLVRRQHRKRRHGLVRGGAGGLRQLLEMAGEPFDGRAIEQRGAVLDPAFDARLRAVARRIGVQRQVELRTVGAELTRARLQAAPRDRCGRHVHVREHDLEQRAAAAVARRVERFHQLLERQVAMFVGVEHGLANAREQRHEIRVA